MDKVILIVGNNASRTGAPILLLNQLKWIRKNTTHQFIFILQTGGELTEEFRNIGKVYFWEHIRRAGDKKGLIRKNTYRLFEKLLQRDEQFYINAFLKKFNRQYSVQLVLSNTAINGNILAELKKTFSPKIITYVHEGEILLAENNHNGLVSKGLELSDVIIAVSGSVRQVLINKFQVARPVVVIPGAIDTCITKLESDEAIFEREGIPPGAIKIMACGYPVWQKGIDFFIRIAYQLSSQHSNVHFIWLGGEDGDEGISQMKYDIEKLNLGDRITLIATKKNAMDYIDLSDIFLVLSRNESFSLVTLEAGYLSKPLLCFDKAGGPCEIVNFDLRFIVPYGDIDTMCNRINLLLQNPALRLEMGECLQDRIKANYMLENSAGDLLAKFEESIKL